MWYAEREDAYYSNLDVDDTDSYGPETVTIMDLNANKYFKYGVVDFTNFASDNYGSYDMSYSNATVKVYSKDGLVGSFHVPEGKKVSYGRFLKSEEIRKLFQHRDITQVIMK